MDKINLSEGGRGETQLLLLNQNIFFFTIQEGLVPILLHLTFFLLIISFFLYYFFELERILNYYTVDYSGITYCFEV